MPEGKDKDKIRKKLRDSIERANEIKKNREKMNEVNKDQVKELMGAYYKSIPSGRARHELRFSLQQSLEKINYALSFNSREEMLKRKGEIEEALNSLKLFVF